MKVTYSIIIFAATGQECNSHEYFAAGPTFLFRCDVFCFLLQGEKPFQCNICTPNITMNALHLSALSLACFFNVKIVVGIFVSKWGKRVNQI